MIPAYEHLILHAIAGGYTLSVADNGVAELDIDQSTDTKAIIEALQGTEAPILYIRDTNDQHVGWAKIIIGQGMMDEETVADFGDNAYTSRWFGIYCKIVDQNVHPVHARFWTNVNGGLVRLSMVDGQDLAWKTSARTDEGWHSEVYRWFRRDDVIIRNHISDGVDCDGRLTRYDACRTTVAELDIFVVPNWEPISSDQRDENAEMAGY